MATKLGTRVQVFSGDGEQFLGYGMFMGVVTTYSVRLHDGSLWSQPNAEEPPTEDELVAIGGELVEDPENPKIQLDNGQIVYGCQVYWQECAEELN